MRRRTFLQTPARALAAGSFARAGEAVGGIPTEWGEPHEVPGKRIFFTDWRWVRPGDFRWTDREGVPLKRAGWLEGSYRPSDVPAGIRLVAQKARRVGPLMRPEHPWEERAGVRLTTVIQQDGIYRGWSHTSHGSGDPLERFGCYYESSDGFDWVRPRLGIFEFNGSRDNNIVMADLYAGSVFVDPAAPVEERYKLVSFSGVDRAVGEAYRRRRPEAWEPVWTTYGGKPDQLVCIRGGVSPDGLRWTIFPDPLVVEHSDTQVTAYYDRRLARYVMYTRRRRALPRAPQAPAELRETWRRSSRRSIGRSESADFHNFPLSEIILEPSADMPPSCALYTNCRTNIPGIVDYHLMFPAVWNVASDTTEIYLASSQDGKLWHFVPGSPVFSTGAFGEWDGGCVFSQPNLLELPDGSFALPYMGYDVPHKYPRDQYRFAPGYAVWPKGRLVALEAAESGQFATMALMPPGRKLRINAVTKRAGSILVEVASLNGRPLAGRSFSDAKPLFGDIYREYVSWGGLADIGSPEGAPVILRFRLSQAQLYALEFD